MNLLRQVIPLPRTVIPADGQLYWNTVRTVQAPAEVFERMKRMFLFFGHEISAADGNADLTVRTDPVLKKSSYRIQISGNKIDVTVSDDAAALYASGLIGQLLCLSHIDGSNAPCCSCGTIEDEPELQWRGMMLDCVRHFIRKDILLDVIRILSEFRINILHLHLTDSNAWRPALACMPDGAVSEQHYTLEDLREIAAYAKTRGIMIVPEIEMPGHSWYILSRIPELNCAGTENGSEYCLTSPFVRNFLRNVLREIADIFPESTHIHLGGDETGKANWEKCPDCRKACEEKHLSVRQLEHEFVSDMCRFVHDELHRIPICWSSHAEAPEGAVMQAWRGWDDIAAAREAHRTIINSLLQNYYFDYPENPRVPRAGYAPKLDEECVYMSSPYHSWKVEPDICGIEACLWTERVPDWRLYSKILSRIAGFAETAWTPHDQRSWNDFQSRKQFVEASTWLEQLLRNRF